MVYNIISGVVGRLDINLDLLDVGHAVSAAYKIPLGLVNDIGCPNFMTVVLDKNLLLASVLGSYDADVLSHSLGNPGCFL